ncbi:MAG: peptidoglycan-binding protein [Pseudorhodobacter sp.]|nr:peptidoglycan-binding protein [Pseudorhodobacter sp.]
MKVIGFLLGLCALVMALPVMAQDKSWLQIEAQPNLNTAMDRVRAYAALFPDVEGYRLRNGWYGIALGPTTTEEAAARLLDLRRQNLIPADSYLANGASYAERFWPVGQDAAPLEPPVAGLEPDTEITTSEVTPRVEPEPEPAVEPAAQPAPSDESLDDSRAAEAALTEPDRQLLQEALKWYGFYSGALDGSFGKGTRASFAAWQAANGFDETGILTTSQRNQLTGGYANDKAEFGFQTVAEAESGIEITLPLALIQFDRYEPPFVHYADKDGSGLKVLLISEPGGAAGLKGLFDVLQTLEVVPPQGQRVLAEDSFTIHGRNDQIETLAFAAAVGGNIKGYLISWNLSDADRMARILPVLQASFRSSSDKALDPGLVPLSQAAKRGLLAGLDVRRPKLSRSGFFVNAQGAVLTTLQAVESCGKVVVERSTVARVSFTDAALGIALLTPDTPLAPKAYASFATSATPGAKVSLSGYSYEDKLPAPAVTYGVLEDTSGLNGEPDLTRLTLTALPGDTGGPVLDTAGNVLGMLLPPVTKAAQQLPSGVAFAASASALTAALTAQGLAPAMATSTTPATPDAMDAMARDMTVLVSCWE